MSEEGAILHVVLRRAKRTFLAFLSPSGFTWMFITWMVYAGKLAPTFLDYAIFTCALIGIKTFKPKAPPALSQE